MLLSGRRMAWHAQILRGKKKIVTYTGIPSAIKRKKNYTKPSIAGENIHKLNLRFKVLHLKDTKM